MVLFELKKIFSKPSSKIIVVALAVVICVAIYLAVCFVDYVDANGNRATGISAAHALKEEKNGWSGYITEEMLAEVIDANYAIVNSEEYLANDVNEQNKAYSKQQGFSDIRELINHAFCGFQEYNYYRVDSVTKEEVKGFYDRRTTNLIEWLNDSNQENYFTEQEKLFLINQYEKLETPLYYEYSDGWEALLEYSSVLIMLMVLIAGFLVAGIFPDERQLKADSIFFSTVLGRNKAIGAKVKACFVMVTTIYWGAILLFTATVLAILGTGGANCAIQVGFAMWKSFYNITYLQAYILTVMGGYLGSLFILLLSAFVAALTHSKAIAATAPFVFLFIPSFLSGLHTLSEILGILPDQLLQMPMVLKTFNLYQFGDSVIGAVPIILIVYTVLVVVLLPMIYRVYQRAEVK